jgi:DNA helicase-2/ATP-dependent DNA helicase PcrA
VPESAALSPEPAYLASLNAPQREAVLTTEGPVLVLAGAGTGKTAALTARLAHLIATRKAWPSEILSVTFTNKAAREMRERIARISGGAIEGMPWLGTFHSIAAKMLRIHAELVGLQSNFTILDTDDQLRLMKQLIVAAELDEKRWPARQLAGCIDRWKNKGLTPEQVDAGEAEAFANGRGADLYAQYQARLKAVNACDFGDLLLHMLVIFRTQRDVLERYQTRFRYLLVDEYQDTNAVQYEWLKLLAEPRRNLCCVGDDDQSIYSWRGEEAEQHQRRGKLSDVAILVRAQFQTREFEERFIAIGLPYQIVGGFRFYERAEIRDALAYLRLVQSPSDDLAFERIVNTPKRGLGDKAIANIHRYARAAGMPLLLAAAQMLDSDELTPQAKRSLGRFVGDLARWRQMHLAAADAAPSAGAPPPHAELARQLLDESGYTAMLQAERTAEAAGRLENLAELTRAMEEYENLSSFLEHVSLVMDNDADKSGDKVTIMTIHAAKGLEFPIVYLAGWEEGVFPSQRALDEGGTASLEEERRLAYVAITRAREKATIFHAANRRIYGQWTSSIPSRFVAELPKEHVEEETTMTGGESLWRAQWSEHGDPFAHVAAQRPDRLSTRGPGFGRAAQTFTPVPQRIVEARASAVSLGNKGRDDLSLGQRVFHGKFGYGQIAAIEGNKLEIDFEHAGRKRVLDSFVSLG